MNTNIYRKHSVIEFSECKITIPANYDLIFSLTITDQIIFFDGMDDF